MNLYSFQERTQLLLVIHQLKPFVSSNLAWIWVRFLLFRFLCLRNRAREVRDVAHTARPSGAWHMKSLRARELGGTLTSRLPEAHSGSLTLGDDVVLRDLPIKPLDAYRGMRLHYLDLSGTRASCLDDFGGDDETLAGVTKLYAGRCLLTSLRGLERFSSLRYLYLDQNLLESLEWTSVGRKDGTARAHSLFTAGDEGASAMAWSPQRLLVVDLLGNPLTAAVG